MKKHSYFYLEMKEHHLKVPYTGKIEELEFYYLKDMQKI